MITLRKIFILVMIIAMLASFTCIGTVNAATAGFVYTNSNYFMLDGNPFYFAGTNNYYLNFDSNTMIDDVLNDAAAMNLKVIRCWGFIDGSSKNDKVMQPSLGVYDESGFERMDYTIYKAGTLGLKLVIPFINNWSDFGGIAQYVSWTGAGSHDAFFTNTACKTAYKNYINYMLNRQNTYTGVKYKDDPAIMTWELANEPRCDSDTTGDTLVNWADEMSTYIKGLDSNHLVAVGDEGFFNRGGSDYIYNGGSGVDWDRLITLTNIDYGTFHLYPDGWGKTVDWGTQYINEHITTAKTVGKPAVFEEYGILSNRDTVYQTWNDAIYTSSTIGEGAAGSMFWLLTGIMDDGTLYPDYDGFRVIYPSTTATVLSGYADLLNAKPSGTTVNSSSISPTSATFDKYTPNQADISVAITENGNTFNSIRNGSTTLVAGTDYTVSGSTVTILKSYLAALSTGTVSLTFDFSAGADPVLTLTVTDSTPITPGALSAQMFNASTAATSNSIYPRFKLTSSHSSSIDLSSVKIRYYYTIDGEVSQNFWCDWSTIGKANVTGTFDKMSTAKTNADYYLEIGFATDAGSLASGESIEVQARFAKTDWSNYTQTGDYSFNPTASTYADWSNITVYYSDSLLYGIEP